MIEMEDIDMALILKDREFLNNILASKLLRNHKPTQALIDAAAYQSVLFKERVHELRLLLDPDHQSLDYDNLEMMSQYFDPMHVFLILSKYINPQKLLTELLNLFRMRGSEGIRQLLFEVFLYNHLVQSKIDYAKGSMLAEVMMKLLDLAEYYDEHHQYPTNFGATDELYLLCRELLVGGHRLVLNNLGVLTDQSEIDGDDDWSGKITTYLPLPSIINGSIEYFDDQFLADQYFNDQDYDQYFTDPIRTDRFIGNKLAEPVDNTIDSTYSRIKLSDTYTLYDQLQSSKQWRVPLGKLNNQDQLIDKFNQSNQVTDDPDLIKITMVVPEVLDSTADQLVASNQATYLTYGTYFDDILFSDKYFNDDTDYDDKYFDNKITKEV